MITRQIPIGWTVGAVVVALIAGAAVRGALATPATPVTATPIDDSPSRGVIRASSPGPKRWIDGAPSGFSHDEDGARAAAITYSSLATTLVNAGPALTHQVVGAISSVATAERRIAETDSALGAVRSRLAGGTGPIVLVQAPVLIRTDSYSDSRAGITLWTTTVIGRRGIADPQSTWATITLELVWERGDWRLDSDSSVAGPTPDQSADAPPPSFDEFESTLRGARPVGSAT